MSRQKISGFLLFLFFSVLILSYHKVFAENTSSNAQNIQTESTLTESTSNDKNIQDLKQSPQSENLEEDVAKELQSLSPAPKYFNEGGIAVAEPKNTLLDWVEQGGMIMYLIFICSFIGTYITIERIISLRASKIVPKEFSKTIISKLSSLKGTTSPANLHKELLDLCEEKNSPSARTLRAGLLVIDEGIISVKSVIDGATELEGAVMEKNLNILGLIANIAPLLGFLGTVIGMISAFESIVYAKSISAEIVAGGISKALITTAAGLFVGIPFLAAHHFFQGKIDKFVLEINDLANEAAELLHSFERKR